MYFITIHIPILQKIKLQLSYTTKTYLDGRLLQIG